MMHLCDILGMKITDFEGERRRIEKLFNERYYVSTGRRETRVTTFKEEAEYPFRRSCFRGTCVNIDDLFSRCCDHWSKGDLESLLLYCEVITNIVSCVDEDGVIGEATKSIGCHIFENIQVILEKTGYEIKQDEHGVYFIAQKNAIATDVIHDLDDKYLALAILEYNRFSLKGDIDRKRELLNVIGQAVEPLLKDRSKRACCPEVYDDIRFALNRLNIRHNNVVGANEQPALKDLSGEKLETAYDDLYSSMLVLLKISQLQEGHARMKALKERMTKV